MARQKKTEFTWNGKRLKAAKLMAEGDMCQEEIAKECNVVRQTVNGWCQQPEFKEKVTELILLDERATKAGILKRALTTLEKKTELAGSDKSTELDYLKFISDFLGHTKQGVDVTINSATAVIMSPEVSEKANELSRILTAKAVEQVKEDE